ncbi:MAG: hypothetical protein IPL32_01050 [Chloracidobacterium sp.]|nr:hypothetical protein [Chloracidobacterium sp.]
MNRVTNSFCVYFSIFFFLGLTQIYYGQIVTGDAPLTADQVDTLNTKDFAHPQSTLSGADGAALLSSAVDLSIHKNRESKIDWELEIKNQGALQSCQSVAVSYAADILERKRYYGASAKKRVYHKDYIWEILRHKVYAENDEGCPLDCTKCGGFSIYDAAEAAGPGILFSDESFDRSCGKNAIVTSLAGHTSFTFNYIWSNPDKYPRVLRSKFDSLSRLSWAATLRSVKENLSSGVPILVSIFSAPNDPKGFALAYERGGASYSHLLDDSSFDYLSDGWHAMTIVGYDDTKDGGAFKLANSWVSSDNSRWGQDGYLWITYSAFQRISRLMITLQIDKQDFPGIRTPNTKDGNALPGILQTLGSTAAAKEVSKVKLQLIAKAKGGTNVCLDANTPDWIEKKGFEVIMYRCGRQSNQLWRLSLREQRDDTKYYFIESLGKDSLGKVLAVNEGRLTLSTKSVDFDENQLWNMRTDPDDSENKKGLAIFWAGQGGLFVLEGDQLRLDKYSDDTAPEPFVLNPFNNLDRQKWTFVPVE